MRSSTDKRDREKKSHGSVIKRESELSLILAGRDDSVRTPLFEIALLEVVGQVERRARFELDVVSFNERARRRRRVETGGSGADARER